MNPRHLSNRLLLAVGILCLYAIVQMVDLHLNTHVLFRIVGYAVPPALLVGFVVWYSRVFNKDFSGRRFDWVTIRNSDLLSGSRLWIVTVALVFVLHAWLFPKWTYDDPRFAVMTGEVELPASSVFPHSDTPRTESFRFIPIGDHAAAIFERERAFIFAPPPPFFQCSNEHQNLLLYRFKPPPKPIIDWASTYWRCGIVLLIGGIIWKKAWPS